MTGTKGFVMSLANEPSGEPTETSEPGPDQEIQQIRDALQGLKFGSVTIIVQDGVVVQIDRTEKRRLRRPTNPESQNTRRVVQGRSTSGGPSQAELI